MSKFKHALRYDGILDAAESAFFQRELERIVSESFDVKRSPLKARKFLPVDGEGDPGDETVVYRQYERTGKAQRITDYAKDLSLADAKGVEFRLPVHAYGDAIVYSIQELRAAAKANRPLSSEKMRAARAASGETHGSHRR